MIAEVRAPELGQRVGSTIAGETNGGAAVADVDRRREAREVETVRHRRSAIAEQVPLVGPDPHDEGVASLLRRGEVQAECCGRCGAVRARTLALGTRVSGDASRWVISTTKTRLFRIEVGVVLLHRRRDALAADEQDLERGTGSGELLSDLRKADRPVQGR